MCRKYTNRPIETRKRVNKKATQIINNLREKCFILLIIKETQIKAT